MTRIKSTCVVAVGATIVTMVIGLAVFRDVNAQSAAGVFVKSNTIRVIDGDTIEARDVSYRLVDMDAPETGRTARCAREITLGHRAKRELESIVNDARRLRLERVDCSCAPKAKEGTLACNFARFCARLYADGRDVAHTMIERGYAVYYPWRWDNRPAKNDWCN